MSDFSVDTEAVKKQGDVFSTIISSLGGYSGQVSGIAAQLCISGGGAAGLRSSLQKVVDNLEKEKEGVQSLKSCLEGSAFLYSLAEKSIMGFAMSGGENSSLANSVGASAAATAASGSVANKDGTAQANGSFGSASASARAEAHAEDGDYGANASANAEVSVLKGEASASGAYGEATASGSVLSANAEVSAGANLHIKDGIAYGEATASAAVMAAVASAKIDGQYGTEKNNVHAQAEGSVLEAAAEAKTGITVNENGTSTITAKAGAEAYLAKGEVSGGFSLFGVKVDLGIEGGIGVEAKAGGEVSTSGIELEVGLGPIGGTVGIDWSDFSLNPLDWF